MSHTVSNYQVISEYECGKTFKCKFIDLVAISVSDEYYLAPWGAQMPQPLLYTNHQSNKTQFMLIINYATLSLTTKTRYIKCKFRCFLN